jgi:MFS family permease
MQTLILNAGTAGGQALGSAIASTYSIDTMFYVSSAMALLSVLLVWNLKETLEKPEPFSPKMLLLKPEELYESRVLIPALVMILAMFPYGAALTVVPDYSQHLGIGNKGFFFSLVTLSSLATRLLAGRASDRWGREIVIKLAMTCLGSAMIFVALATTPFAFLTGACLFGMAHGMAGPNVTAWSIDLAHHQHIGRALATTYFALEIGVLCGAFVGGAIFANQIEQVAWVFYASAACAFAGLCILVLKGLRSNSGV